MSRPHLSGLHSEATTLQLHRPLVFFDLETTGVEIQTARVVELCAIKLNPDGSQQKLYFILNPGVHIPEGATAIHGFSDKDVAGKPSFCDVANEVCSFFTDCDLGGYNIRRFDIPVLMEEFHRCNMYPILLTETKVVDVMSVYHKKEPRDLSAAVRFYCNGELDKAHSAGSDIEATIQVLHGQLQRYSDLSPDVPSLHTFSCDGEHTLIDFSGKFARNREGRIVFNFGKHKDRIVDFDNDDIAGYISWMKEPGRFTVDTLMAIRLAKAHHSCHKICTEWLQSRKLVASVKNLQALHQALTLEKDVFPFCVSREGKKLTVFFHDNPEPALVLCSADDELTVLFILQHLLSKAKSFITAKSPVEAET